MYKKICACALIAIIISGCKSSEQNALNRRKPNLQIQAGINKGGITENTDLTQIETVPLDAYSGATHLGANSGIHTTIPLKNNDIETGIDAMLNRQTFSYNNAAQNHIGRQNINTLQIMIPLTYNFGVFKKWNQRRILQFKLGYNIQFNFITTQNKTGKTPEFQHNTFSHGFTTGVTTTPIQLKNGNKIGFYIDLYRGSQILSDYYNRNNMEEPGSSFFKCGILYQFEIN